jgi:uncharacterized repeat protein (TIGR03803 family)
VFHQITDGISTSSPNVEAVVQAKDGKLYGIASQDSAMQGQYGGGTLFSLTQGGALTVLHAFGSPSP